MTSDLPPALAALLPDGLELLSQAPGRANLIGEHTDYNDGLVLPVALEIRTAVAGHRWRETRARFRSIDRPGIAEVDLRGGRGPTSGWGRYVTAVVRVLRDAGLPLRGIDAWIASTVPVGTGLSSSAALEVALALALLADGIDAVTLARLCRRAENVHVGVQSGIMDQLVCVAARAGSALFIDCASLETDNVPVPRDLAVLVIDSGQRRELADGDYNRRRAECERAARLLGVATLRDLAERDVDDLRLPPPLDGRVRHVVGENARVDAARRALRAGDRDRLRELFAASHASLATDYAVSTPRLDALVEAAGAAPGVVGARMTGAGFGGCIVALVEAAEADAAAAAAVRTYRDTTGHDARAWVSRPAAGALQLAGRLP